MTLPADPFADGLAAFGRRLRSGTITAEAATRACLARIAAIDPALHAFEHVAGETAEAEAAAIDRLLAAGTDIGPLMGVPVAVKDILAVEGMPTRVGSNLDLTDLVGPEGSFIRRLRQAGCVILGKTHTVEIAFSGTGINRSRGTPRNPWDADVFRVAAGSSSGSAVAVAAGLCGFAVGSDTGGSIRSPAAFCGVFGLKTTKGLWPTDGAYPLSPTLDTIGVHTRTAGDTALLLAALDERPVPPPATVRGLRFGRPVNHFFDNTEPGVAAAIDAAIAALSAAGAIVTPIEVPEIAETDKIFYELVAAEAIGVLGRDRFLAERDRMDPDIANGAARGLDVPADRYMQALWAHQRLCALSAKRFESVDAWLHPTRPMQALPMAAFDDPDEYQRLGRWMAQNTRHANAAGLCAVSMPVPVAAGALPVGLQLTAAPFAEEHLLRIAEAVEAVIGTGRRPDLTAFASPGGRQEVAAPCRDPTTRSTAPAIADGSTPPPGDPS